MSAKGLGFVDTERGHSRDKRSVRGRGHQGERARGYKYTVEDDETGQHYDFEVTSGRDDFARGFISHESPMGRALHGRDAGHSFEVDVPTGRRKYRIVKRLPGGDVRRSGGGD